VIKIADSNLVKWLARELLFVLSQMKILMKMIQ